MVENAIATNRKNTKPFRRGEMIQYSGTTSEHLREKIGFPLTLSDGRTTTYGFEIEPVNRRVASSNLARGAKSPTFATDYAAFAD
jgi:hypothetical protein